MAPTGEGRRIWMFGVWEMLVVHHGMKNACGGNGMMLRVYQSLRTTTFFGLFKVRILVISFLPDFAWQLMITRIYDLLTISFSSSFTGHFS